MSAPFTIARTVDEALAAMATGARPIAGGTDLVVGARQGKHPLPDALVAIDRIDELGRLDQLDDGSLRVGATVTHATIVTDPTIVGDYTALADGAALIGSPATRHLGTIGGNIMNASPAMDTGAPLTVLNATVDMASADGIHREVVVNELWEGPGRTRTRPDELCVAVRIPAPEPGSGSAYVRLEYRRAMEIAVVGAAASVGLDGGQITSVSVALAAVAPTIIGVAGLDTLVGHPVDDATLAEVAAAASDQAQPISDLRASDRYRRHTVGVIARRAVAAAAQRAAGEPIGVPVNRNQGLGVAL